MVAVKRDTLLVIVNLVGAQSQSLQPSHKPIKSEGMKDPR